MKTNYLYRCVADRHVFLSVIEEGQSSVVGVKYQKYPILKETEKGFWIPKKHFHTGYAIKEINNKKCRFVLKGKGKRFANLTREEALNNLLHRAYSRHRILDDQQRDNAATIRFAESALERAKSENANHQP